MLREGIYRGWVQHQRHHPKPHQFQYPLAMVMLDVEKLQQTCARSSWWSWQRFNLISLYASDYLAPHQGDIKTAVLDKVFEHSGQKFDGSVRMLTHPRYLGFVFNPVSFYFCYDGQKSLRYIIAEINNTPWKERYSYVLAVKQADEIDDLCFRFGKQFHISPFMPMDINYEWRFRVKGEQLDIHMTLLRDGEREFDASMQGHYQPFTTRTMRLLPLQYPLQTVLVIGRIYWQAMKLWLKRIPFYSHPPANKNAKPVSKQSVNGESP